MKTWHVVTIGGVAVLAIGTVAYLAYSQRWFQPSVPANPIGGNPTPAVTPQREPSAPMPEAAGSSLVANANLAPEAARPGITATRATVATSGRMPAVLPGALFLSVPQPPP